MLIQSSLPGPAEESFSLIYKNGTCDWGAVEENLQKSPNYEKNSLYPYEKLVLLMDCKSKSCSSSSLASSQLSSVRTMDENSGPTFVYHRRKPQKKSVSIVPAQPSARPSDGCLSYISSEAPSTAVDLGSAVGASLLTSAECSKEAFNMNSESTNGRSGLEADLCCVNDSYSSSKSNVELGSTSLRTEVDEVGECSSSSVLVVEGLHDNMSERDMFICILRNQWFLEGVWPFKIPSFAKCPGNTTINSNCLRTCKVCEIQDTTLEMLICDQCDEAFHVSCCNPRIKKIPIDEWFCYSCLKKKHKILNEMTANIMQHNSSAASGSEDALSEEKLGPIASMLIDIGPYTPGVRIGQEFQADVPDWSGPSFDLDIIDEPADVDLLQSVCLHGQNSSMLPRISSIGNWVQCRQVVEGIGDDVDGTICGKWRRAPLFEVQTDNWECFRAVLWDPAYADCAVPQELDTDQVLKQLKYIEMLRPRLNAKRRRSDQTKDAACRKESNTEDARKS